MRIGKRATVVETTLVIEDGPIVDYTSGAHKRYELRVRRIEVRWVNAQLVTVTVSGPEQRGDGTEITWSTRRCVYTSPYARPPWLVALMDEQGWPWPGGGGGVSALPRAHR